MRGLFLQFAVPLHSFCPLCHIYFHFHLLRSHKLFCESQQQRWWQPEAQGVAYNKGEFQRIMRLAQTPPPPLHIRSAASLGEQISNKESARRERENGGSSNPLEYILISARPPRFYLFIFNQRSAEKSTAASGGGLRERVRAHHRACSIQYRNVCSLPAFDKRYYDGHCEGCQVKSSSHCCCCIMYI
jgi:hypothetical protein